MEFVNTVSKYYVESELQSTYLTFQKKGGRRDRLSSDKQ